MSIGNEIFMQNLMQYDYFRKIQTQEEEVAPHYGIREEIASDSAGAIASHSAGAIANAM